MNSVCGGRSKNSKFAIWPTRTPTSSLPSSATMPMPTRPQAAGDELLQVAIDGIEALNQRHGEDRFYLFHRERVWTECEQSYIGWERKRGKLEELNRLISGETQPGEQSIVHVGDAERLTEVRFVITLDSDTQLLRDTARRLSKRSLTRSTAPPD